MICGYARVSTKLQEREGNSLEAQEQQLKVAGARIVFTESFTGATLDRPQLLAKLFPHPLKLNTHPVTSIRL